jgi:hypothetical protein
MSNQLEFSGDFTMTPTLTYVDALVDFESDLLTPVVPGEVEEWLERALQSAELVSATLWRQTQAMQNDEYSEITSQDAELQGQVEQLMRADEACLDKLACVLDQFSQLKRFAARCEADESLMRNSLEACIRHGLNWVQEAKRQQKARDTWFAEAFYRDRGVGD